IGGWPRAQPARRVLRPFDPTSLDPRSLHTAPFFQTIVGCGKVCRSLDLLWSLTPQSPHTKVGRGPSFRRPLAGQRYQSGTLRSSPSRSFSYLCPYSPLRCDGRFEAATKPAHGRSGPAVFLRQVECESLQLATFVGWPRQWE